MEGALEARGMTKPEATAYLGRLKAVYGGAKAGTDKVTRSQKIDINKVVKEIETKFPVDVPILERSPVKVHPDIASEMQVIFGKRFTGKSVPYGEETLAALETVSAFAKKSAFAGSLFHHYTLGEGGLASGVGRKALSLLNPFKIYKALKNKDYAIYQDIPAAKGAIKDGHVNFGPLADVQISKVDKAFKAMERKTKHIPIVGKLASGARKTNTMWDRALWDYMHNNLKLYSYEAQVANEMKRLKPKTAAEVKQIKEQVGDFVNNSFGGQQWEMNNILGNPKIQQLMQLSLISPDWTVSTLKQAAAPVKGLLKGNKSEMVTGAKFWGRAAMYNTLIAQAANYTMTKKHFGKGSFTWENDPEHKLNIFIGFNEDGSKRYLRTGKQFKEALEWAEDPLKKLSGKMSPIVQEIFRQRSEVEHGGFPTEFKDMEFWESLPTRAKSIASNVVPMTLRPYMKRGSAKNFMMALHTSKGMTNFKTLKLFGDALKEDDFEEVKKIYISALGNRLDGANLLLRANSKIKSDITYDDKNVAEDIAWEMKGMTQEAKKDLLLVYEKKNILTENVAKQFLGLIEEQDRIDVQQKGFGILQNKDNSKEEQDNDK
jgi:hypothetical protein